MGTTITSASASSSSSLSTSSSSAAGGSGGGLAGSGSASSMVAPAVQIDFEELLTSRSKEIDSDKLKSILLVPADDISAQQKPREFRTVRSPVPVDYKATSADPVVSACVEAYVTDWNVIANKYSGYSKKQEKSDDSPPLNLPERSYEVDEKEKSLNGGGFGSSSNNSSPNASSMSLTIPSQFLEDNNSPSSSRSASPAPGQSPRVIHEIMKIYYLYLF